MTASEEDKAAAKEEAQANTPPQLQPFMGPEDPATGDSADDDAPGAMQMGPAEEVSGAEDDDAEGVDDSE